MKADHLQRAARLICRWRGIPRCYLPHIERTIEAQELACRLAERDLFRAVCRSLRIPKLRAAFSRFLDWCDGK